MTTTTKPKFMVCMGEDQWAERPPMRLFRPDSNGDLICTKCGWYQSSVASGAYELVMAATWHNMDAYRTMCRLAQSGGYQTPNQPPYWED